MRFTRISVACLIATVLLVVPALGAGKADLAATGAIEITDFL